MLSKILLYLLLFALPLLAIAQQLSDYEKANQSFNEGKIDESYIHLKNSLNDNPEHLPSKILMGYVLGLSGYFPEAEIELKDALQNGADPNLVIEPLVNVLLTLRKYQEIIDVSDRQLTPAKRSLLQSSKGIAFSALGQFEQSAESFQLALELSPQSISALNSYAKFLIDQAQYSEAESILQQSLALDNSVSNTYLLQSFLFKGQNKPEQEIIALR